jgi:hypothetical protein
MSAFGPKQTYAIALHMSAFGGKADMSASELFTLLATDLTAPLLARRAVRKLLN